MYISVLTADLNTNPWLAVQWSNNLQALLDNNGYEAGVNREFRRTGTDRFIQTKSIREISTPGSWVTAHVYQVIAVHLMVEVVAVTSRKKKKATPKKKVVRKAAPKKKAAKEKSPSKKAIKKSNKKSNSKKRK